MSTRTQLLLIAVLALSGFSGCHLGRGPEPSPAPSLRVGMRPFGFDEKHVTDFWIAKNDAATGDRWTARLTAASPASWELASGPNDAPLVDRLADSEFVQHLLSTLQTLEVTEVGLAVTHETAGLVTPKFVLRWQTAEGPREAIFGQALTPAGATYALLPKLAPGDPIVGVRGATLGMLDHLKSFDVLRHRRLWTWNLDDVERFEVFQGVRKTFTGHRLSGEWADDQDRVYQGPVQEWLERLMHLMILKFNDDPVDAQALRKKVLSTPAYRILLRDRGGQTRSIAVSLEAGAWWAVEDSRDRAVFRMDGDVAGYLLPPRVKRRPIRRGGRRPLPHASASAAPTPAPSATSRSPQ